MTTTHTSRLVQAQRLVDAGVSLVAIKSRSKSPAVDWKPFQQRCPTNEELADWTRKFPGMGIICGEVSGNLEALDLEAGAPLEEFSREVKRRAPELLTKLPRVQTPSGGRHLLYRCAVISGNQKLAGDEDGRTLIETRGEGGQVVSPLSDPGTHPSGKPYRLLSGDLTAIPTITPEEREILFAVARSFNRHILPRSIKGVREAAQGNGTRPGEDFNNRSDALGRVKTLLTEHGWSKFGDGREGELWSRPGVDDHSSATLFESGTLFVFSSNANPFGPGESYSPFAVYAELNHAGNFSDAAKDLAKSGFGSANGYTPATAIRGAAAADRQQDEVAPEQVWPNLHTDARYGLAGDIVKTLEPETESDPVAILAQVLVWFGNCIGRSVYFRVEQDQHYLNLDAVLVGSTSKARKGTSAGRVRHLFESVDEEWANNRIQSGLSSGEGLVWGVRDALEEKRPVKEKGRTVDYEIVIADHGVEDKRLLVLESEFAGVLRVMGREGNTLSPVIRQAWDSGRLRVMTKNSPAKATDAHISIVGHVTIEELRRNLDETETANGFANRILWTLVRRSKSLPEGGRTVNLNSLISRLRGAIDHARGFTGEIRRDDEARALWFDVYEDLSAGNAGLLGSVTSRAEAQVTRLSAIYAMLDCADAVRVEHLRAALALWNYCHDSAAFIFGCATGDRTADTITSALREVSPDGLTRTQISDLLGRHKGAGQLSRSLALLQERGLVSAEQEPTDGRPTTRYFYIQSAKKAKKATKGGLSSLNSLISHSGEELETEGVI